MCRGTEASCHEPRERATQVEPYNGGSPGRPLDHHPGELLPNSWPSETVIGMFPAVRFGDNSLRSDR